MTRNQKTKGDLFAKLFKTCLFYERNTGNKGFILKKLPSPDKGFLLIKRGQAMVQATFTIQIWVAFSPLPEELPHTRMNWPDARSAAVASDISDLAPPS